MAHARTHTKKHTRTEKYKDRFSHSEYVVCCCAWLEGSYPGSLLTRMPSQRETARSGRRARNVRMDRNAGISAAPTIMAVRLIRDSWTGRAMCAMYGVFGWFFFVVLFFREGEIYDIRTFVLPCCGYFVIPVGGGWKIGIYMVIYV